jgi:hypothetical protein
MASVKDVERLADDLEGLVANLREELRNGLDFDRLVQISDEISEHADNAATTFNAVNETLMSRIQELQSAQKGSTKKSSASGSSSRQKSQTSS